jgi:hypothetical protein
VFVPEADLERLEKPLKEFRKEIFHLDYMSGMVAFAQARELLLCVRRSGMKIPALSRQLRFFTRAQGELKT